MTGHVEVTVEGADLDSLKGLTEDERTSLIVKHGYELMKLLVVNDTGMDMLTIENREGKEGPRVCFLFGLATEDDPISDLWQRVMKGDESGEEED